MKNTNFCAKANMKRDANRVEPARRVLLKAGAVLLAVLVLFCTACGKRGSGDAIQTNLRCRKHLNPFRSRAER